MAAPTPQFSGAGRPVHPNYDGAQIVTAGLIVTGVSLCPASLAPRPDHITGSRVILCRAGLWVESWNADGLETQA